MDELKQYIIHAIAEGKTPDQIRNELHAEGWDDASIEPHLPHTAGTATESLKAGWISFGALALVAVALAMVSTHFDEASRARPIIAFAFNLAFHLWLLFFGGARFFANSFLRWLIWWRGVTTETVKVIAWITLVSSTLGFVVTQATFHQSEWQAIFSVGDGKQIATSPEEFEQQLGPVFKSKSACVTWATRQELIELSSGSHLNVHCGSDCTIDRKAYTIRCADVAFPTLNP